MTCGNILDEPGLCCESWVDFEHSDTQRIQEILGDQHAEALATAIRFKNDLLERDQNDAKFTKIYDDAHEWFEECSNKWATKEEEKTAQKIKEAHDKKAELAREPLKKMIYDHGTGAYVFVDDEEETKKEREKLEAQNRADLQSFLDQNKTRKDPENCFKLADLGITCEEIRDQILSSEATHFFGPELKKPTFVYPQRNRQVPLEETFEYPPSDQELPETS